MNGFGFIEYEDPDDARDVVPSKSFAMRRLGDIPMSCYYSNFRLTLSQHSVRQSLLLTHLQPPSVVCWRITFFLHNINMLCRSVSASTRSSLLTDADIYAWLDGSEFMGERLVVQYARGSHRAPYEDRDGSRPQPPRPRRTQWRMAISGLPDQCSWQDLKDFARSADADVVYSEVLRERDDQGAPKG